MPLLTSPIDGSPMRQINRYGIEIDVCPTSGGIWLDKGELEKLSAFLATEAESVRDSRRGRDDDDDDDWGDRRRARSGDRYGKRKGGMSRIMDIFDF